MAAHAGYVLRAGSTCVRFLVYARAVSAHGTASAGQTGLAHDSPGAAAAYVREGEPARRIAMVRGRLDAWTSGGFVEVDPDLVPGLYQLDVPDEVLATGVGQALLLVRFSAAVIDPIDVALVGYDPRDSDRMGMASLEPILHGRFLRMGMPGLARLELALWDESRSRAARTTREDA